VALVISVAVFAGWFDSLNVLHGAALWVPVGVASACLLASIAGRSARWWRSWGAGLVAAATIVVLVARWWIRHSGLVLDKYPTRFVFFVWFAVAAVGIAVTGWWSGPVALRAVRVLAAPASVLAAFLLINSYYGYWPTVATLLNKPVAGQVSKQAFARFLRPTQIPARATPRQLAAAHPAAGSGVAPSPTTAFPARAAPTLPRTAVPQVVAGHYGPVDIPGTAVGFPAAQAYVWLPPDFASVPHANLSVMVMLPGWPGNVQDWTRAGGVTDTANTWARAHGGHAPVMVFIDENGAAGHDTECVNSIEGRAESYLVTSVPLFLTQTLGVTPDPSRWALVGYSEGGTCAITLALRHPDLYGRFVDIAGDAAPNYWGGPAATLRTLYDGSMTAEELNTPGWLLQRHRYPGMVGWLATSNSDPLRTPNAQLAVQSARAGVEVQTFNSPGGHTWTYARQAFARIYPGLIGELSAAGAVPTGDLAHVRWSPRRWQHRN
jgi:S-formylglutathione hydrolase FrmB